MATAHDVARYILRVQGEMTTWKLQKLVYYSQAWHLVWEDEALFDERIEAWANGPVVRSLYDHHRGEYTVSSWPQGKVTNLTTRERSTIDSVLKFYGERTGKWLSDLTHQERPWNEAREGVSPGARSGREITPAMMADYYGSL
ncbi:MAG TPA: type II toxin-antitoxin system antitoxin SocA domain-containing protein [Gaiellaceae bacterium]|nr:type II toxin-antitoxin system antitoxin SocA domain-containing protein [Gaiellaceae bacterium]